MIDPLSINYSYSSLETINKLSAYDTSKGADEMLDLLREIQQSGNYYWQGLAFPPADLWSIPAGGTLNGTVIVAPGTYVTSITHYCSNDPGFNFKLYDKGTKASIFYGDYAFDQVVSSNMSTTGIYATVPSDPGSNSDIPFGPNYLMSPFIITGPGVIGWELVNLDTTNAATIQILLSCAVPITSRSIMNVVVNRG